MSDGVASNGGWKSGEGGRRCDGTGLVEDKPSLNVVVDLRLALAPDEDVGGWIMPVRPHRTLWNELAEELRRVYGDARYERWLAPLKVVSKSGITLQLAVPNDFMKSWFSSHYSGAVQAALSRLAGETMQVEIIVDPSLFHEPARERERIFGPDLRSPYGQTRAPERARPLLAELTTQSASCPERSRGGGVGQDESPRAAGALSLEGYVVGPSNQLGINAARQVLERPGTLYNPLFLHGSTGLGKTHVLRGLFRAFRAQARRGGWPKGAAQNGTALRAKYVTAEEFTNDFLDSLRTHKLHKFRQSYRSLDLLLVDEIHCFANKKKTQEEFLCTFNAIVERSRQVILASEVEPRRLENFSSALLARFAGGLVVGLKTPDRKTRLGILSEHAKRLDARLTPEVLAFVAESVSGGTHELLGALRQLYIHTEVQGSVLGKDDALRILAELIAQRQRRITLPKILDVVATHCGLAEAQLLARGRTRRPTGARQIAMYLARRYTTHTLAEIGRFFGGRAHSAVKTAEAAVERRLAADSHFVGVLDEIIERLES